MKAKTIILPGLLAASSISSANAQQAWPDSPAGRLAVLAELQTLNADLLSHPSATLTLERWCARHRMAKEVRIVADRKTDVNLPASQEIRNQLQAGPKDRVAYRHVELRCGEHVLSKADNWYLPARLSEEMNHLLETTDTAFGHVVQPLHFKRRTVAARLLWSPLPEDWDISGAAMADGTETSSLAIGEKLIEHRAILTREDGSPFSFVIETYTGAILDFTPPPGLVEASNMTKTAPDRR
ncbi:hypothetical protein [Sphingobium sp.]|uniref:hypothetical protein n=1 Tax=Sphingobium sp. TaxID=1912891 RepID=UPI002C589331|nr:hypothetical protein [Sphingobium sp.]HUD92238.1 hypothetical protein [Sphingobium sp.]